MNSLWTIFLLFKSKLLDLISLYLTAKCIVIDIVIINNIAAKFEDITVIRQSISQQTTNKND